MEIDYRAIGKQIRKYRLARHLTQQQLGELSDVEPSNISHIERGATKLSFPTLIGIANALEVSLDALVYENIKANCHVSIQLIDDLLEDCSSEEMQAIVEMIETTKRILRKRS